MTFTLHFATINTNFRLVRSDLNLSFTLHFATINTT